MKPNLVVLKDSYIICQFDKNAQIPVSLDSGEFFSFTRTEEEVSIVCKQSDKQPSGDFVSAGDRRIIKALGPFDLSLTGIIAGITSVLAKSKIPVFTISTFNTDYILVEEKYLGMAVNEIEDNGYNINFE